MRIHNKQLQVEIILCSIDNVSVREVGQDWTLGTGWSIGEDKAIYDNSASSVLNQSFTWEVGKTYKITFDIGDFTTSQRFDIYSGVSFIKTAVIESDTSYTIYFNGDGGSTFRFRGLTTESFSVTNISVKEVLQNWSVEDYGAVSASAVITPNTEGVKLEKTVSADWRSSFLVQPISYTSGSQYKVTFRLKNGNLPSGGNVYVRASYSSSVENIASNLVLTNDWVEYTYYFLADSGSLDISFGEVNWQNAGVGEYFYIDDVSVIEITDDTNLPRINYEGFSYQDALGSELITNGGFDTDSDWLKNSGWTISGGTANTDGTINSKIQQSNVATIGKTYKYSFDVLNSSAGTLSGRFRTGSGTVLPISSEGTFSGYFVATSDNVNVTTLSDNSATFSIDNVSVKEYLGQEVVPDSGCGSWLWEPQSTNLITQSELFSDASWVKINSSVVSGFASPSGNTNAYKLIASVSNTDHRTRTAPIATAAVGTTVTFSIYIKPQEITKIALVDNWTNLSYGVVNLTTNSVIEEAQGTTSVTEILNGFRRVSFTYQTANINTLPAVYLLDDAYTSGNPTAYTFASDGTSGVYIWGAILRTIILRNILHTHRRLISYT